VEAKELTELPTDPKSPISGLTAVGHLREINESFPSSIVDLLYSYRMGSISGLSLHYLLNDI
jgi:hypothetical protein